MVKSITQEFISRNKLQPGDVLLVEFLELGVVRPFVPFLGYDTSGLPVFAVKSTDGFRFLKSSELPQLLNRMKPYKILRFQGNGNERQMVVSKARANLNFSTFNLLLNWSDSEKKRTKSGPKNSPNWGSIALGAAALALLVALISKDE